jgi:hypothetical protein
MLKWFGLSRASPLKATFLTLAVIGLLVLGTFAGYRVANDGSISHTSVTTSTVQGFDNAVVTTVALPPALLNETQLAGGEMINLVSTTSTGVEDGLGTGFAAALPLLFYTAILVGAIAVAVIGCSRYFDDTAVENVKKARRRRGRVALNSLLRPLGTFAAAIGILLLASLGTVSEATVAHAGSGGYLGQDDSAGFPMWTLVALALGSFALVAGGLFTRRVGK